MTEVEIERVTDFVRRFCSVQSRDDGSEPEFLSGYFGFYQGKSARHAKKARASIPFGDFERCASEVLRRARELTGNGEGHVFVRAYYTSDSAPAEVVRLVGSLDEAPDEIEPTGSAVGDLTAALVRTNSMLLGDNQDLRRLVLSHLTEAVDERERFALMTFHAHSLETGMNDARMQQALTALAPTLEKVAPHVVAMVGTWLTGGGGLPEEPGARIEEGIRRVVAAATDVGRVCQAHPALATAERTAPLLDLLRNIAPALGVQIVPLAPASA